MANKYWGNAQYNVLMREMKIMMKMTVKDMEQPKLLALFLQRTLIHLAVICALKTHARIFIKHLFITVNPKCS